jgi:NTP pyrophosphatase (non-canonical NTP hydrolase)
VLEIGYAIGQSVPVFCSEAPNEATLLRCVQVEADITKVIMSLINMQPRIPPGADLSELQAYIRAFVHSKAFEQEALRDVVLLLMEEVGELARAVRREIGLKTSQGRQNGGNVIAHELADCLIYLLDIANLANVDLDTALREKDE